MKLINNLWKKWLKFGKIIGHFQALIIFTLFYFVILWPVGLIVSFFTDPLNFKSNKGMRSNFNLWLHPDESLELAHKPY